MAGAGVMISLPASLTLRDAQSALESLRQSFAAGTGEAWRINAAPVTQLDTSALAVLLECARIAAAGHRKFEIVGASARLSDLAQLYGVDGLLGVAVAPVPVPGETVAPVVPPRVGPSAAPKN
jgi:phospholipid transport system transporter-binding protein